MGITAFELQKVPTHLPETCPGSKGGGKGCTMVERGAFTPRPEPCVPKGGGRVHEPERNGRSLKA